MQKVAPLLPGKVYHIYNRGVNRTNIFLEERNYQYFLDRYWKYIPPVAETFAYCLLKNHFHFLVRIRERMHPDGGGPADTIPVTPALASKAFNNLFTAYAKGINKTYGRTGALFQHHFGRRSIASGRYFAALVRYIHLNPRKHGFVEDIRNWPYSSYHTLAQTDSVAETASVPISRATVLDWLGGPQGVRDLHANRVDSPPSPEWAEEEDDQPEE